jgi:hypothetical protein
VCRYAAPGNVIGGDWEAQVRPPLPPGQAAAAAAAAAAQPATSVAAEVLAGGGAEGAAEAEVDEAQAGGAAAAAAAAAAGAPAPMRASVILANALRARHGAPPLAWSAPLARGAAAWAAGCPAAPSGAEGGASESIGLGHASLEAAIAKWYAEVRPWAAGACLGLFFRVGADVERRLPAAD